MNFDISTNKKTSLNTPKSITFVQSALPKHSIDGPALIPFEGMDPKLEASNQDSYEMAKKIFSLHPEMANYLSMYKNNIEIIFSGDILQKTGTTSAIGRRPNANPGVFSIVIDQSIINSAQKNNTELTYLLCGQLIHLKHHFDQGSFIENHTKSLIEQKTKSVFEIILTKLKSSGDSSDKMIAEELSKRISK
jgi:hypothetical protein